MIFSLVEDMGGVRIRGLKISNLRFVKNKVFFAKTPEQLQEIVNKVYEDGKLYGMKINAEKPKAMLVSKLMPSAKLHIIVDKRHNEASRFILILRPSIDRERLTAIKKCYVIFLNSELV